MWLLSKKNIVLRELFLIKNNLMNLWKNISSVVCIHKTQCHISLDILQIRLFNLIFCTITSVKTCSFFAEVFVIIFNDVLHTKRHAPCVIHHLSWVMSHMSWIMCHASCIMCHASYVVRHESRVMHYSVTHLH